MFGLTSTGLLLIVMAGLMLTPTPRAIEYRSQGSYGLALVFVLFTYGGWTEAAYIGAELDQVKQNMIKSLVISISLITSLFLLLNLAYLQGLGLNALAQSDNVAADLMARAVGEGGADLLELALTTL